MRYRPGGTKTVAAPWRSRALARLIDGLVVAVPSAGAFYVFARRAKGAERLSQDGALPAYARRVLATAEFALEALAGCGQSPGCRLAHVYPISLRSARRVGPARALVRASVTQAETLLMRPGRRTQRRWGERRERIASAFEERRRELHAVGTEHKGDKDALERARAAVHARHDDLGSSSKELRGTWMELAKQLAVGLIIRSLLRRLRDALTGKTIVIAA